jgi:endonuclease/exonuclease/phosphatase family metal-dependent hydrolase
LPLPEVSAVLRVATYNIHKGVRGLGPARRLEIHNLGLGIAALAADVVCLQEVRLFHQRDAQHFDHTYLGWPEEGQAEFLAPEGYASAYRSNAITRHGEHGNALLSRLPMGEVGHEDVSDHRFEQRGLLHVPLSWQGRELHVIVVHLGLIHASRVRQVQRLGAYLARAVPAQAPLLVAGDFNDWSGQLDAPMRAAGLQRARAPGEPQGGRRTFPSKLPVFALDRVYLRGLCCVGTQVPHGPTWARMSDHLPLLVELDWA